ncbi:MAG TPA: threonine/serine dehydratase [Candidatus Latescibacteria bacterium]|jgi:threonine dehydratase|nr:threonine/serine dehydratase [Candidatus Latescibacterota bacterium]HCV24308.1 threonine ammonia-lyase [Candidatus Latescibacterota bacterium]HJN28516.1 threonine/serine dehydratase [Candidatus Latescibacterota bacterium]
MRPPNPQDIAAALAPVHAHLPPTPLIRCPALSERFGCDLSLKCESFQPVGAFKVRGGVYLVSRLAAEDRKGGLISASTGNHGQSIAYAGRLFAAPVVIYAPAVGANEAKLDAMRHLGADVRQHGKDFDEARERVEQASAAEGLRYIHSANEPDLIAGVGTMGLEILDEAPQTQIIVAPIGGGSGAAGISLAVAARGVSTEVIGAQSAQAPAAWHAWSEKRLDVEAGMSTRHEGLATRVPFQMTMEILWERLQDFVLVQDSVIDNAVRWLASDAHLVAEGAGAAAVAVLDGLGDRIAGKRVVAVVTGGNLPLERYASLLQGNPA